jgi:putative membrane protein
MDRRHLLAGIAELSFASAAFAQTAQPQSSTQAGGAATVGTASGTQAFGQAEQRWLQQTMMVGSVALQTSEIALQKAEDEEVKQFAKFEADEQKGLAEVLRSMLEPAGTASPQSVAGAAQPDQKHAVMIQKLQQAKAVTRSTKNSSRVSSTATASFSRSRNREHIEMLEDLQG